MVTSAHATATILVVEDDPAVAGLVRAILNDVPGWSAIVAYDAPSAMEVLAHVPADVLVVDVNLPGMSGVEMLSKLRRDRSRYNPPAVIMSANVSAQRVKAALGEDEFASYLAKPFDIDDLIEAVQSAITCGYGRPVGLSDVEAPEHPEQISSQARRLAG